MNISVFYIKPVCSRDVPLLRKYFVFVLDTVELLPVDAQGHDIQDIFNLPMNIVLLWF